MHIGVPKEIRNHEYRMGMTPAGVWEAMGASGGRVIGWNGLRALVQYLFIGMSAVFCVTAWAGVSPEQLMTAKCAACHLEGKTFQRISDIRKSPEGWEMTLVRMGIWHKVELSQSERKTLVKYLADKQGLAPEESAPYRFLIERRPNVQDVLPTKELGEMCARCHSFGRVALQRRDLGEWRKLVETHVGQFPSIEYSAMGRDRNWLDLALNQVAPELAKRYPLHTAAWRKWRKTRHVPPTGTWRVVGNRPGWGDYAGYMYVQSLGADRYGVRYELQYDNGDRLSGQGHAIVYTGYEWRGAAKLGNQEVDSIFALSQDGKKMSGRWFLRDADEVGAQFGAVRVDATAPGTLLAVSPALIKTGATTTVRLSGVKLGDKYDLGSGVKIDKLQRVSPDEVRLTLTVAPGASIGWRYIKEGRAGKAARLALYRQIDSLRVEPAFAIARLGGGGSPIHRVSAQFQAIAYLDGPDGKAGTKDDIRLGPVTAKWSVENFDDTAKAANDVKFAGVMEPNGQFMPAQAGPNPARNNLDNVGNLSVVATLADGQRSLTARGHLVVAVQRWNTPPLR